MKTLMSFEEMKQRYEKGEDSLELTIEKWERIRDYLNYAFNLFHFQEVIKAASVPIFLCVEYKNQCPMCPIYKLCERGKSPKWINITRILEAYALAGDMLPKEPLIGQISNFLEELKQCKEEAMGKAH